MSDTPNHLNVDESDSFESALSKRLRRRATEPLGMIDVRYAEEKYLRIVRWLGRCTALLDHLSRRYGVEQTTPYGDRPFAIHRRGAQLNISNTIQTFLSAGLLPDSLPGAEARSNTSQSSQRKTQQEIQRETWKDVRPSGLADILAERSTSPVVKPSPSSEGTFRISRRPPPGLLESDAPQISRPAATPMKDATGDRVSTGSAPITQQMPFRNTVNEEGTANVTRATSARELDGPPVTPATANERGGPISSDAALSIVQHETPGGSRAQERPAGDAVKNQQEDASSSSRLPSLPLVTPTIVRPQTERVSSEGTLRISRRPPPGLPESDAPQISRPAATPMKDAKGDWVSTRSAQVTQQMPFRNTVNEEASANVARTTNARELGQPVTPATANERGGATSSDAISSDAASSIVQRETPGGPRAQERPAGDAVKNQQEDESASSRLHSLPLVTPTIARRRTGRVPSAEPGAKPGMRFDDAIAQDGSRPRASSIPSMTEAFESRDETLNAETPELVLRRGDRETDAASPPSLPGTVKTPPGVSRAAVASEIPGESVSTDRLDLVFREHEAASRADGSGAQDTPPLGSSNVAKSSPVEFAPSTKRDAQTDSPSSYQAQARELQVEDISPRVIRSISERVMRAITLDLKLERERRGVTKWR